MRNLRQYSPKQMHATSERSMDWCKNEKFLRSIIIPDAAWKEAIHGYNIHICPVNAELLLLTYRLIVPGIISRKRKAVGNQKSCMT